MTRPGPKDATPPPPARPLASDARVWIGIGLVLLTLAAYAGVFANGFVNYDDTVYVTENPHVKAGLAADSIRWAFTARDQANWHPLTWLSHMLDVSLFGLEASDHHLTSLLLHAANAVLLFLLLVLATGAPFRSGFVAGLFALHPLHVESVAWVAERKDVLSTFFWLLTLLAWLFHLRARSLASYALVVALFVLGLMSKPMLVTLPFTLLLLDFWPLARLELPLRKPVLLALVREKAPLFALSALSCVVTFLAQQSVGAVQTLVRTSFSERLANALLSYVAYLGKTFLPLSLAVFYPHPHGRLLGAHALGALLLLAGVSALALRLRRRAPFFVFGWLWYLGTLVPVIGLVQVGSQGMADRYTYVPLVGIFVVVAWASALLPAPRVVAALAIVWLATLLVLTRVQVSYWSDSVRLFEHTLAVTKENCVAHNNLGVALFAAGRKDEAIEHFHEALRIEPDYVDAHNDLGLALDQTGKHEEAILEFERALAASPDARLVHINLGNTLASLGRLDEAQAHLARVEDLGPESHASLAKALAGKGRTEEAITHLREALRLAPQAAEFHNDLGLMLVRQGRTDEGVAQYEEALRLKPDLAEAANNIGLVLEAGNRTEEAIARFRQALALRPGFAEAHNNLGVNLAQTGRTAEAIEEYERALGAAPGYADASNNLGLLLASLDRLPEAIERFRQALQARPDFAQAHNNLGVALAHAGRLDEATWHFQQALLADPGLAEARANLEHMRNAPRGRP